MNLPEMRTKFKACLAGLASAELDADIDSLLNGALQYTLPGEVSGTLFDGLWSLYVLAGNLESDYADDIHSVKAMPPEMQLLTGGTIHRLRYYTRPELFWYDYDRGNTTQGQPSGALFYGRTVTLRPIPSVNYLIRIHARIRPTALTIDGLTDRTLALATVYAAALEYAADMDHDELMVKLNARYQKQKDLLKNLSLAAPSRERKPMRSF